MFTAVFVAALALSLSLQLWLAHRHARHVAAHRERVPEAFADRIGLAAHQKAADYTIARTRFGVVETLVDAAVLVALTLGGGLAALAAATGALAWGPLGQDLALIVALALLTGVVGLPFSWHRSFGIEARFGFNRSTRALWIADLAKGVLLAAVLGLPLAALVLWLMRVAGPTWWLWTWAVWIAFQFLILLSYPTVIAPLFNKFSPLPAGPARDAIERLLARCGFENRGLFVMDGSRRSSHGNAFFTGFGRAKRIVLFDTLLARLGPDELEAVLAHELGHFRLRHVLKRMAWMAVASLAFLALLAWLMASPWFYAGLGVAASPDRPGIALILFFLVLPVFTFLLGPLFSLYSRRHEFEADAFAARHASSSSLVQALVKLYEDNAATLTPDPMHSAFYDSHPPAAVRIARLRALAPAEFAAAADVAAMATKALP
ncbi:MAG: M48 family metallopeptidase [Betaproteobacteria bacterium]|nr:M48 family metallopeptidase [Betaproteobacteria bacterium]